MDEQPRSLVVLGASAGGVEPLKRVLDALPGDLPAAVGVVLHVPATGSRLPEILNQRGSLLAAHAVDGELLRPARIYVAPPDRHLLVRDGRCVVLDGPREHGFRPAVDPLFRSAAREFGRRVVAVVLSGSRNDGAAGAAVVADRGGCVIVQDPAEADFPGMPATTVARDHPDRVMPADEIAGAVLRVVRRLAEEAGVSDNGTTR